MHAVLMLASILTVSDGTGVPWIADYAAARKQADLTGKMLVVSIHATWCGPCRLLEQTTLRDPAVVDLLNATCIPLSVDGDDNRYLVDGFAVTSYPTNIFVAPNGKIVGRVEGYVDAAAYASGVRTALAEMKTLGLASTNTKSGNPPATARPSGSALAQNERAGSKGIKDNDQVNATARDGASESESAGSIVTPPPPAEALARNDKSKGGADVPPPASMPLSVPIDRPSVIVATPADRKPTADLPKPPGMPKTDALADARGARISDPANDVDPSPSSIGSNRTLASTGTDRSQPKTDAGRTTSADSDRPAKTQPRENEAGASPNRGNRNDALAKADVEPTNPPRIPESNAARPGGRSDEREKQYPVALKGFCPVSMFRKAELEAGLSKLTLVFNGERYFFAGTEERDAFLENPQRYLPTEQGHCVVTWAESKQWRLGMIDFPALFEDRLYLFPSGEERNKFLQDPERYVDRKGRALR